MPVTDRGREQRIVDAFVEMSSMLVDGENVSGFAARLLHHGLTLLDVDAGGILLHQEGELRLLASSDDTTNLLELLQLQRGEGPCFEAFRTGEEIVVERLADRAEQWPAFVPRTMEAGFHSMHAVPLRFHDERLGAMNTFSRRERVPEPNELALARGLADVATVGIVNRRVLSRTETTVDQLEHALASRIVIEQAKGRIAERAGLDMTASFELLRAYSRARNLRLDDTARAVVERRLSAEELQA
ncbi:MAG: GAF and ANTAR domain-containing protein [Actinomycetota bacterium]|nr:GAF and ANTAR domain-containing protein [Actinomycetota bacterium]